MSRIFCLLLCGAALLLSTDSAFAQRKVPLKMKGQIKAVKSPFIQMNNTSGNLWVVKLEPKNPVNDIVYHGMADPKILRPGLLVRFSGEFDAKGKPLAPISEMFVFVMREGYRVGISPDGVGTFLVAGQLTAIDEGKIRVKAGRQTVNAELAPDVKVNLDLADLTFVQPGDQLEVVKGYFYEAGQGYAEQVIITGAKTVGEAAPPEEKKE